MYEDNLDFDRDRDPSSVSVIALLLPPLLRCFSSSGLDFREAGWKVLNRWQRGQRRGHFSRWMLRDEGVVDEGETFPGDEPVERSMILDADMPNEWVVPEYDSP